MKQQEETKQYRVMAYWGARVPGEIIQEGDIPSVVSIAGLLRKGIIEPIIDGHIGPMDDDDAAGWKARAISFEEECRRLRTATTDAAMLSELEALRSANDSLRIDVAKLQTMNADLASGVVKISDYEHLRAQLSQAMRTIQEMQAEQAKSDAKALVSRTMARTG